MKTSFEKFMASKAVSPIKVEMATIADVASRVQKAKAEIDNFNSEVAKLQSIAKTQSVKGDGIISALEDILDMYNEVSTDFKKLGIDPTTFKEVKAAKDLYYAYYNGVKQLTLEMKNIL
jgi:cytochrome c peroxidase